MLRRTSQAILSNRKTILQRIQWNHLPAVATSNSSLFLRNRSTTIRCFSVDDNDNNNKDGTPPPSTEESVVVSIEDQYSRKTPLEHVLLRPGMYVGSVERQTTNHGQWMWMAQEKKILPPPCGSIVPALVKIVDEILVNASDNQFRYPRQCTRIDVVLEKARPLEGDKLLLSVRNNGPGIPVEFHPSEQMYVPELVFGHLLTGSNFGETSSDVTTGGRHGYGAKLTNIFSHRFTIDTICQGKRYQQTWRNNMHDMEEPIIEENLAKSRGDYTKVTFVPDFERLGDGKLLKSDIAVLKRRVMDIAACLRRRGVKVTLNHANVSPESFEEYCQYYIPEIKEEEDEEEELIIEPVDVIVHEEEVLDELKGYEEEEEEEEETEYEMDEFELDPQEFEDDQPKDGRRKRKPRHTFVSSKIDANWEVVIGLRPDSVTYNPQQPMVVSFVNGINTIRGGTHVQWMTQQIVHVIQDHLEQHHSDVFPKKPHARYITSRLFLGLNVFLEDPSFDSQAKELCTSAANEDTWPFLYTRKERGMNNKAVNRGRLLAKMLIQPVEEGGPGIIEAIVNAAMDRKDKITKLDFEPEKTKTKQSRRIAGIPKLEDAHDAGKELGCTLILTEGDSAKALAVAGLEVVGRSRFGVFPLRGKFVNVKQAKRQVVSKNAEVQALVNILGLDLRKSYATVEERNTLRYQHVLLMTDQDNDGTHIKGLLMNFFRHYWPDLLLPPDEEEEEEALLPTKLSVPEEEEKDNPFAMPPTFLSCFVTPLLKATNTKTKQVLSFYNMAEYQEWEEHRNREERWTVKYYKGLGTSTPQEAKEYFRNFSKHIVPYFWKNAKDGMMLDMVFDQDRASDRRKWIIERSIQPDDYDDDDRNEFDEYDDENPPLEQTPYHNTGMSYQEFLNQEFIHFSNADNIRSLPHVIDGLKPSQRKVLYACLKRSQSSEIKVAQLTGYCAEHTAYHHGELSLQYTIVNMAQDFTGSNNLNLLVPNGQFGTRFVGGADAASARYIYTKVSPVTRLLFPKEDDVLLHYVKEEGQNIEPVYYCPIIPTILVNGAKGIGTGWSTTIHPHNPLDLIEYLRNTLRHTVVEGGGYKPFDRRYGLGRKGGLKPWVRGFQGSIQKGDRGFVAVGRIFRTGNNSLEITELPVGRWTNEYKNNVLLKMQDKGLITSFKENHTTTTVHFVVHAKTMDIDRYMGLTGGLHKKFMLHYPMNTTNMNAFCPVFLEDDDYDYDYDYDDDDDDDWTTDQVITKYESAEDIITQAFLPVRHALYKDRHAVLQSELNYQSELASQKARFVQSVVDGTLSIFNEKEDKLMDTLREQEFLTKSQLDAVRRDHPAAASEQQEFDYLLRMPLKSLTSQNIDELYRLKEQHQAQLQRLQETIPEQLWLQDLDALEDYLTRDDTFWNGRAN